nr:ABC transporter permease subunit [Mediterraneibacter glycyrrhizinilyticus]
MLSEEEKGHTTEFLLPHPVSRTWILSGKLTAFFLQILVLNAAVLTISLISIYAVGEDIPWKEILLLYLVYALYR